MEFESRFTHFSAKVSAKTSIHCGGGDRGLYSVPVLSIYHTRLCRLRLPVLSASNILRPISWSGISSSSSALRRAAVGIILSDNIMDNETVFSAGVGSISMIVVFGQGSRSVPRSHTTLELVNKSQVNWCRVA